MLLTTHYMFEADELCDRIAVIAARPDRRRGHAGGAEGGGRDGNVVEVEVFGVAERGLDRLRALPGVPRSRSKSASRLSSCSCSRPGLELTQPVLGALDGTRVGRVATREPTLEDAYVALVTEEAE